MPGKGPAAVPTKIKALQGKRGAQSKLATEPVPAEALPEPPIWFTPRQKALFYEMRDKVDAMKLASASDREMLQNLTLRLHEVEVLSQDIETNGRSYETTNVNGGTIQRARPEVRMLSDALRHAQTLLHEFGLSPAARSKVHINGGKNGNEWNDV